MDLVALLTNSDAETDRFACGFKANLVQPQSLSKAPCRRLLNLIG